MTTLPAGQCLQKALKLLARRPHFRSELAHKLLARDHPEREVESTLDELERQGLIDDRRNALRLADGQMTRRGFGPRRMHAELRRRGVAEEVVSDVLEEIFSDPDRELRQAQALVRRWRRSRAGSEARLARHLDRKGYSKSVILGLLEGGEDN